MPNRSEALEKMAVTLADNELLLLDLGIKTVIAYDRCLRCKGHEELGRIQHAATWLSSFVDVTLAEYQKVKDYHTPEQWTCLAQFGKDQVEEIMLRQAVAAVKRKWRKRPSFFKTGKRKTKEKGDE